MKLQLCFWVQGYFAFVVALSEYRYAKKAAAFIILRRSLYLFQVSKPYSLSKTSSISKFINSAVYFWICIIEASLTQRRISSNSATMAPVVLPPRPSIPNFLEWDSSPSPVSSNADSQSRMLAGPKVDIFVGRRKNTISYQSFCSVITPSISIDASMVAL